MIERFRQGAAFAVALAVVLWSPSTALADEKSDTSITAKGPGQCVVGTARIGHGSNGSNAFVQSLTGSYDRAGGTCLGSGYPKVAGNLRSRIVLQKKTGGNWGACRDSGVYANTTTSRYALVTKFWGVAPCGNGAYRAKSFNHSKWSGSFHGGHVISPNHSWPGG